MDMLQRIVTTEGWWEMLTDVPIILIRTFFMFLAVLAVMRWTGKRSLSDLAPFDFALVIVIGEVAAIPLGELNVDLLHGLVPMFTIGLLHYCLTKWTTHNVSVEQAIEGRPTLLIKDGKPLKQNMDSEHVSEGDLKIALRFAQVKKMAEVQEAWLEHAGGISVVPKKEHKAATPKDLQELEDRLVSRMTEQVEAQLNAVLNRRMLGPSHPHGQQPPEGASN